MEEEIIESEALLAKLIQRLSTMGLSENISEWLEGDGEASQSFFEFLVAHSLPSTSSSSSVAALDPYRGVELIASKSYNPQGVVTITIYFRGYYYVIIADGQTEQPLLDSKFPDVSEKGRGYQLRSYSAGVDGWPELRKVSIWQTARALKVQGEKAQAKLEEIRTAKGVDAMEAASIAQRRMEQLTMEALRSSSPSSAAAAEEKGSRPIYSPEASSSKIISSGSTSSGTPTHAVTGMTRSESGRGEKEEVILRDDDDEREEGGRGGELTTLDAGVAEAKVEAAPTAVEMKLANEVLRRGSTSDRIGEATTTTPAATAAGGGGGGGRRGSTPTSSTAINSNGVVVGGGIGMGGGGAKALQPLGGTRVALPHHLAPMQGDTSALKERLRQLQNEVGGTEGGGGAKGLLGGGLGPAPWDVRGRPLGSILLGGKGKIEDEEEGDRSAKK